MERINVVIAGMGMMGKLHTRIYKSLKNVNVIGLIETDKTIWDSLEAEFKVPVYSTAERILSKADIISVCTPDHLHKDIIIQAFMHKVKVLVEKPLDITTEGCNEILSMRPDPSYLMVGHILRFDPRVWHIKKAIESGEIGQLYSFNIRRNNTVFAAQKIGKRTSINWYLGIHDIDLLLWLTGLKVKEIQTMGRKILTDYWDYVISIIKLENEVISCVENGWILPGQRSSKIDAELRITGENGSIEVDLSHGDVVLTSNEKGGSSFLDTYYWPSNNNDIVFGALRLEIETFIDSAINNIIPPVTGEQATEAVEVVERIEHLLERQEEGNQSN